MNSKWRLESSHFEFFKQIKTPKLFIYYVFIWQKGFNNPRLNIFLLAFTWNPLLLYKSNLRKFGKSFILQLLETFVSDSRGKLYKTRFSVVLNKFRRRSKPVGIILGFCGSNLYHFPIEKQTLELDSLTILFGKSVRMRVGENYESLNSRGCHFGNFGS